MVSAIRHQLGGIIVAMSLLSGSPGHAAGVERTRVLVPAGDARIDVIAEGHGPLIVMLPSRGRNSEDYDEVAAAIAAQGFRVLRPQPRGIGATVGPMDNLTLHDFARDVAAVIEAEKDGPAVIVGHAYGNWVARMTAVDRPDLVRGVVLAAAAAKSFPPNSVSPSRKSRIRRRRKPSGASTCNRPSSHRAMIPRPGSPAGIRRRAEASASRRTGRHRPRGGRPAGRRCSISRRPMIRSNRLRPATS